MRIISGRLSLLFKPRTLEPLPYASIRIVISSPFSSLTTISNAFSDCSLTRIRLRFINSLLVYSSAISLSLRLAARWLAIMNTMYCLCFDGNTKACKGKALNTIEVLLDSRKPSTA